MQGIFAIATLACLVVLVRIRIYLLKKLGIKGMLFGKTDKREYAIFPFILLLLYLMVADVFGLPTIGSRMFHSEIVAWIGVGLCALALLLFAWAMVSFRNSFRVGIDEKSPGELITGGAFAISRNPIYVAFAMTLMGIFCTMPNWFFLLYIAGGCWLFNRQVMLEEAALAKIYGETYRAYCKKVHRYL